MYIRGLIPRNSADSAEGVPIGERMSSAWTLLTLYLIEMTFNGFANRPDPDQAILVRALGETEKQAN